MPISEMNMSQLVAFLERKDITESQRAEAMARLEMLSNKDFTSPNKPTPTPKPRPTMEERGYQKAAHGGMIHRGRKAGLSAEKAR